MTLWSFLKEKMLCNSQQTICEKGAKLSFEELIVWAERFSKELEGIRCCAILCKSQMATAMALLGCFAAGVTALPLSLRYGEKHCQKILETISPDALITDENGEFQICTIFDSDYKTPKVHPALIMCTSGTTGTPKGIMLSEKNIIANVSDIADYFKIGTSDSILISRPLFHCAVLTGEFLCSLIKGTKITFFSDAFDPIKIISLLKQEEITVFGATPTLLNILSDFKNKLEPNKLKHICVSGECMDRKTGKRIAQSFPKRKIYHVYGLTEAAPRVAYLPPELFSRYPDHVGLPLNSISLKLLTKDGKTPDAGKEGVIWIKGPNVMIGYYNDKAKTSETIKKGWLCTNDIGVINKAGLLKIKGRCDDIIIRSGMNIYPAEIESALKTDPRVKEVLVFGYKTKYGTQIGVRIVGDFSSSDEVKKTCIKLLPMYQVPSLIELVDKLPKNGSGKIIRGVGKC